MDALSCTENWKAAALRGGFELRTDLPVPPSARPVGTGVPPPAAGRCARRASTWCQPLFKSPPSPAGSCRRFQPCLPELPEARGSRTPPAAGAATGAWVPQACSGLSWLSSRRGCSVSWEGEHGGRDATVWVRGGLCAARQSGVQSEKAGAVPDACLPPARSGGTPGISCSL